MCKLFGTGHLLASKEDHRRVQDLRAALRSIFVQAPNPQVETYAAAQTLKNASLTFLI